MQSSVGLQVDRRIELSAGCWLSPFARIAWVHEFNPDRGVDSFLTMSPTTAFSPIGASAAGDLARVNAGLRIGMTKNVGLFAYFDGDFSGQGQSYAGSGGVRIVW